MLYVTTSERLRAAYWIFLKDVFRKPGVTEDSETRDWWSGLRYLSMSRDRQTTVKTEVRQTTKNTCNVESLKTCKP